MGETTPTSWRAGLCLVFVLISIMLIGAKLSAGDSDQPTQVDLVCQSYPSQNGVFNCKIK